MCANYKMEISPKKTNNKKNPLLNNFILLQTTQYISQQLTLFDTLIN